MSNKQVVQEILQREDAFRGWLIDPAARRRSIALNMRRQAEYLLSGNDDPGDLLSRAATLVYLLARGADDSDAVPDDTYSGFASIVVQALANQGAGSEFGRHDLVVQSIDAAIERVRRSGGSATALLVAKARYLSYAQNESSIRLATLRQAEGVATGDDLLRVRYTLTWYFIDASRYRRAIRLCDKSIEDARRDNSLKWVIGFTTNRGIARYTTLNDPAAARLDLEAAVAMSGRIRNDADINRFLSDALHYLGRCNLDDGNVRGSLEHYVMAQKYKDQIPFESRAVAYYHVRMAEALTGAGNHNHAREHMDTAKAYLDRVGDTGAASVSYNYALANTYMVQGDSASALAILHKCARDAAACKFSRGRLLALARIFTISVQCRDFTRAVLTLFRAVPLLFNGELRRNSLLAIIARFRRYALHVFRPYGSIAAGGALNVVCPCPIHSLSHQSDVDA